MKHSSKSPSSAGRDSPLDDFEPALASKIDHSRSRDAGEEAIGNRGVNRSVLDEKDVGAGAFRHATLPVEHQSVRISATLRPVLGDGANHIETRRLGHGGSGRGVRAPIVGDIEPNAFHPLGGIEIARPLPHGDAQVDRVTLRRDAHHFRAAPGDRPDIGVGEMVLFQHFGFGGVDLRDAPGELKVENLGGIS